jgi:hypothetical protein
LVVFLAACGTGSTDVNEPGPSTAGATSSPIVSTGAKEPTADGLPLCEEVGYPTAPEDWYADAPVYVGNEMPIEEVEAFASGLDGYENIWIDRDHDGWITVGFVDADVRSHQAILVEKFPEVGVVAVEMPYTNEDLDRIRQRIASALPDDMDASNMFEARGVVIVWVGRLTQERVALAEEIVGSDPACLRGLDPATTREPGPQPEGGKGWAYLASVDNVIDMNQPVVITEADALAQAWDVLGVSGPPAEVDFGPVIVVAFPVEYSGSCPDTRFDDLVVEGDLLHPVISHLTLKPDCTENAGFRTYLIAVERDILPSPPFRISAKKGTVLELNVTTDLREPRSTSD